MGRCLTKKSDFNDAELLSFALKDVKPLPGRAIKSEVKQNVNAIKPASEQIAYRDLSNKKPKKQAPLPPLLHGDTPGLDKNSARRMKRGKMQIDGRLDLHGYRQDEAFCVLSDFIIHSVRSKKRCVLIITGKGLHREKSVERGGGVLRKNVPIWLNEEPNRSQILSFSHATPSDGGSGALYVLLKRQREGPGR
jgi:DNA-nicking Smr family endonuclease